ncbi:hypothetical protein SK128_027714 [Halocaridina rubra]|uniref:Secreted protein n=1 Tax=Halocaridina rubra TaxID=373956 RepID=A0AAN8WU29_HALRR
MAQGVMKVILGMHLLLTQRLMTSASPLPSRISSSDSYQERLSAARILLQESPLIDGLIIICHLPLKPTMMWLKTFFIEILSPGENVFTADSSSLKTHSTCPLPAAHETTISLFATHSHYLHILLPIKTLIHSFSKLIRYSPLPCTH